MFVTITELRLINAFVTYMFVMIVLFVPAIIGQFGDDVFGIMALYSVSNIISGRCYPKEMENAVLHFVLDADYAFCVVAPVDNENARIECGNVMLFVFIAFSVACTPIIGDMLPAIVWWFF